MNRNDLGLVKNFTSAGPIPPRRVVVFGAVEGEVDVAASPTAKPLVGVTGVFGATAAKQRVDIQLDSVQTVEAGAAFGQGVYLTVDGVGRVIAAAPAATATQHIIGKSLAICDGLGQLVPVHILPGALSNAANA